MTRMKMIVCLLSLSCFADSISLYAQSAPDPGLPGPLAVSKSEYDLGDLSASLPGFPFPVEVRGSVHYPTGLSGGPYPVLVFLHGRHSTCFQTSYPSHTNGDWPCEAGYEPIVSYEGYDYLTEQMASHGYIVISISANAINADDASVWDYGMAGRAQLVQLHLDLWNTYNTTDAGPFGDMFIGKLDMNNIGTMGHSRGGEGVVANAIYNRSLGSPYGIKAVLSLAPVDFFREVLNGIPLMNIAPYCDGDVSDLQGVHYYDDARYADSTDETDKYSVLMMGANHNFYNTVWTPGLYDGGGAVDDWDAYYGSTVSYCGSSSGSSNRLTPEEQQASLIAYASAFFRVYIGHEMQFLPILRVDDIVPPASSMLEEGDVFVSWHAPDSLKTDINRITDEENETVNILGGDVVIEGMEDSHICGGISEPGCDVSAFSDKIPHESFSGGLSQQNLHWTETGAWYENTIPEADEDLTKFMHLQFRAAVDFSETPDDVEPDFSIVLTDTAGNVSIPLYVSNYTACLYSPPGNQYWTLPKVLFNTIKLPLADFSGVDLRHIRSVRFNFDTTEEASVMLSDICLSGVRLKNAGTAGSPEILTNIETESVSNSFNAYPNPFRNSIWADATIYRGQETTIRLIDITGNILFEERAVNNKVISIETGKYASGVYMLMFITGDSIESFKMIKQ